MAITVKDIPKNPATLFINGAIMDHVLSNFVKQYLPAYELVSISGYRNPVHNKREGGAELSAHQWNLAKDFALKFKTTGRLVPAAQLKKIWKEFVKPNWDGYSLYEPGKTTGHIHVNLPRDITQFTKFAGFLGVTAAAVFGGKKIYEKFKQGR